MGGINADTGAKVVAAGATALVAGTYIYGAPDRAAAIHFVRRGIVEKAAKRSAEKNRESVAARIKREDARAAEVDALIERRRVKAD